MHCRWDRLAWVRLILVFTVPMAMTRLAFGVKPILKSCLIGGYGLRRIAKSGVEMADNMQTLFARLVGVKACANCCRSLNKSLISKALIVVI